MREAIRALRRGVYTARDHVRRLRRADHHPRALRGTRRRAAHRLRGLVAGQPRAASTWCMNYTEAYTTYGVKVIVSPDVPNNEGAFRPLRITAPEGSILNVQRPAAGGRAPRDRPLPAPRDRGRAGPGRCPTASWPRARPTSGASRSRARICADQPFTYIFFSSGGTGARADQGRALGHRLSLGRARNAGRGHREPVAAAHREEGPARGLRRRRPVPRRARPDHRVPRARAASRSCAPILGDRTRRPAPGFRGGGPGAVGEVLIDGVGAAQPEGRAARSAGRPGGGALARRWRLRARRGARRRPHRRAICARATRSPVYPSSDVDAWRGHRVRWPR